MNSEAAPLTKEEIEVKKQTNKKTVSGTKSCCTLSHADRSPAFFLQCFLASPTAKGYLFKSYVLMLDFYGIELSDEETGEVKKSSNWEERFSNLNT